MFEISHQAPSLTDWIQAGTAFFGVIGLIVTLLLQRKTMEEQKEMLKISRESERKLLMPIFKAVNFMDVDEYEQFLGYYIAVEVERNDAYDTRFIIAPNLSVRLTSSSTNIERTVKIGFPTHFYYDRSLLDNTEFEIMTISFNDLDGRHYQQILENRNGSLNITAPRLISS